MREATLAMRVLGVDPGSRRTGYGVVEREGRVFKVVSHGTLAPRARQELAPRLAEIARGIEAVIAATQPDWVAVEEAFYHQSVHSTLVLGHVRGAILATAAGAGKPVAEYSPRELKLSVVGHGDASKEQVADMVRRMLGLKGVLAPDAADALAAAICHLQRARLSAPARAASAAAARLEALLTRKAAR